MPDLERKRWMHPCQGNDRSAQDPAEGQPGTPPGWLIIAVAAAISK